MQSLIIKKVCIKVKSLLQKVQGVEDKKGAKYRFSKINTVTLRKNYYYIHTFIHNTKSPSSSINRGSIFSFFIPQYRSAISFCQAPMTRSSDLANILFIFNSYRVWHWKGCRLLLLKKIRSIHLLENPNFLFIRTLILAHQILSILRCTFSVFILNIEADYLVGSFALTCVSAYWILNSFGIGILRTQTVFFFIFLGLVDYMFFYYYYKILLSFTSEEFIYASSLRVVCF